MKARLLQTLFFAQTVFCSSFILADESNNDIRALQEQNIMSVLFQQTSAERLAASVQTYTTAKHSLDKALADPTWSALPGQTKYQNKQPAIILDVDETVLDNLAYQARGILDGTKYPTGWIDWGNEVAAKEVPGAKDFLNYAHSKGVAIFYITNRVVELKNATQKNLTKLGIPWDQSQETILMRGENGWGSDKGSRRSLVSDKHRVLMLVGDNLGDFVDAKDNNLAPDGRQDIVEIYREYWGTKWFMLQNTTYGDWEGALYNFDYSLSPDEVHKTRINSLQPSR
jgi:5'-nucleotidase (lipoprotein e(P4) family)